MYKSWCGYFNVKVEFKTSRITREKATHFTRIKGDIKILNVYSPNHKASKYMMQN